MIMDIEWYDDAKYVYDVYLGDVDWVEGYYICPFCAQRVYETDFPVGIHRCPLCETAFQSIEEVRE